MRRAGAAEDGCGDAQGSSGGGGGQAGRVSVGRAELCSSSADGCEGGAASSCEGAAASPALRAAGSLLSEAPLPTNGRASPPPPCSVCSPTRRASHSVSTPGGDEQSSAEGMRARGVSEPSPRRRPPPVPLPAADGEVSPPNGGAAAALDRARAANTIRRATSAQPQSQGLLQPGTASPPATSAVPASPDPETPVGRTPSGSRVRFEE
eukprot:3668397-Prymnesium_polylepis.1